MGQDIVTMRSIQELYGASGIREPFSEHFDCHRYEDSAGLVRRTMPAHRNMFNMVCLITGGEIQLEINCQRFNLSSGNLLLASTGTVQSWELKEGLRGYVLLFSNGFFSLDLQRYDLFGDFPFFREGNAMLLPLSRSQVKSFSKVYRQILEEQREETPDKYELIRSYLLILLLKARRAFHGRNGKDEGGGGGTSRQIVSRLQALVNRHLQEMAEGTCNRQKQVAQYAEELSIHPNYLNEAVQRTLGKSAGQLVRERTAQEALILLRQTDLTVADVAYRLGFESSAYFSRFFKKVTAYTPSEYRKLLKL